jgi:hypothetical protein
MTDETGIAGAFLPSPSDVIKPYLGSEFALPAVVWSATDQVMVSGATAGIGVVQRYWAPVNPIQILEMEVELRNYSDVDLHAYYYRLVDFDNCVEATNFECFDDYVTTNTIEGQRAAGDRYSAVTGQAADGSYIALRTDAPHSAAFISPNAFDDYLAPEKLLLVDGPLGTFKVFGDDYLSTVGARITADATVHLIIRTTVPSRTDANTPGVATFTLQYVLSAASAGNPVITAANPGYTSAVVTAEPYSGPLGETQSLSGYQYQLDGGEWVAIPGAPTSGSAPFDFRIEGLDPDTTYQVQIRAVLTAGENVAYRFSNSKGFKTTDVPEDAPVIARATAYDGAATVHFFGLNNPADLVAYEVQLDDGSWSTLTGLDLSGPEPFAFDLAGLMNNVTYNVTVRGVLAGGQRLPSNTVPVTPRASEPLGLAITAADPLYFDADITFTPYAGALQPWEQLVRYEYRLDDGNWVTVGGPLPSTAAAFGISDLEPDTEYRVWLRAVIDGVEPDRGPYTVVVDAAPYTFRTEPLPGAPVIIAASPGSDSALISFLRADPARYVIAGYEYQLDDGAWLAITDLPAGDPTVFSIPDLTAGRTYRVTVRALTTTGLRLPSNTVTISPAGAVGVPGDGEAWVVLPADAEAIAYEVVFGEGEAWLPLSGSDGSTPVHLLDLSNGVEVCLRLRPVYSFDPKRVGAASEAVCVTPTGDVVNPNLRFATVPDGGVEVGQPVRFSRSTGDLTVGRNVTLGNLGDEPIINVWLRFDNLPEAFEIVSIVPSEGRGVITRFGPNVWFWRGVTLPGGAETSLTITYRLVEGVQ